MEQGGTDLQYLSTRNPGHNVTAATAILSGLAPDGGLFVPETIPTLSLQQLEAMLPMSYTQRAIEVLRGYLTDFSEEDLATCVNNAYTAEKFGGEKIAPLHKLDEQTYFLELWHGPTCAFKDMALQILPYFLTTSIKMNREEKEVVILVATSGDTGKAALEGFANVPKTKIAVFYPDGGVSPMQRRQMVTQQGDNVYTSAVQGNFDDVQSKVKSIFTDQSYGQLLAQNGYAFSSANSINWGRLVPQIVYYVNSYCQMVQDGEIRLGEPINVVVPTGNFGNILAAYYAKKAGVPIGKLICASNENRVLTDFIRNGYYDKNRAFVLTNSPSMDILVSSNLERLLYDLSDSSTVVSLMDQLHKTGRYTIDDTMKQKLQELLWAGSCDEPFTLQTISQVWKRFSYLIDTHTAVGYAVYQQYCAETGDKTKTIIASTASPFKFEQSVFKAVGTGAPAKTGDFVLLDQLALQTGITPPRPLTELREKPIRFDGSVTLEQMYDVINQFLGVQD